MASSHSLLHNYNHCITSTELEELDWKSQMIVDHVVTHIRGQSTLMVEWTMAWRPNGTKPLQKSIMDFWQQDTSEQIEMEL